MTTSSNRPDLHDHDHGHESDLPAADLPDAGSTDPAESAEGTTPAEAAAATAVAARRAQRAQRVRRPSARWMRRTVGAGVLVVLAGCAPAGGGCSPIDVGPTTTESTVPGDTTTTTESTVPVGGEGSTTTTPGGSTTSTLPDGSTTTTSSTVPPTTVPGTGELVAVEDLEPGTCVTPSADQDALLEVALADCDEPHGVETFAVLQVDAAAFPGSGYPGGADLRAYAYEACQEPFAAYVGVPFWESTLDITTITPSPSSWVEGDREIVCLIVDVDGNPLTGSARNRGR